MHLQINNHANESQVQFEKSSSSIDGTTSSEPPVKNNVTAKSAEVKKNTSAQN